MSGTVQMSDKLKCRECSGGVGVVGLGVWVGGGGSEEAEGWEDGSRGSVGKAGI